ncbi:MAG: 2-isopropylmalate synthase, partial [Actinomycetia bacterium]|nr:2-isopropylmalate synthase [Actinomycetes bacterium]
IRVKYKKKSYFARAIDTDIIKASAIAFLNAINKILLEKSIS